MGKTNVYQHFCPVARSLEVIGEKWSLLIVRDLLRGPQRFTDLERYLGNITPKWLSLRLRELEAAGLVQRQSQPGRREVWYSLTHKGEEMAPVIEALTVWGIRHATRDPIPGEPVHPEQSMEAVICYFNARSRKAPRPLSWLVRFSTGKQIAMVYDGAHWRQEGPGEAHDLTIDTTPDEWVTFLQARRPERAEAYGRLAIEGSAAAVNDFRNTFHVPAEVAATGTG
jgi:DNA-binding HxlR family transcriptional regulator